MHAIIKQYMSQHVYKSNQSVPPMVILMSLVPPVDLYMLFPYGRRAQLLMLMIFGTVLANLNASASISVSAN